MTILFRGVDVRAVQRTADKLQTAAAGKEDNVAGASSPVASTQAGKDLGAPPPHADSTFEAGASGGDKALQGVLRALVKATPAARLGPQLDDPDERGEQLKNAGHSMNALVLQFMHARALERAGHSMSALALQLTHAHALERAPNPRNLIYHVLGRQRLLGQVEQVRLALKHLEGDPILKSVKTGELDSLEASLLEDLKKLEKKGPPPNPPRTLVPEDVATIEGIKQHLGALVGKPLTAEAVRAVSKAPVSTRGEFERNLAAFTLLVDAAMAAPDYRQLGRGWHYPNAKADYRFGYYEPWVRLNSEERSDAAQQKLEEQLRAAIQSESPPDALEQALVRNFLEQIGVSASAARSWKPNAGAIREALAAETLVALRALNETIKGMARDVPEERQALKAKVHEITRQVVEGSFQQWRYSSETSQTQLDTLTNGQRQAWLEPHQGGIRVDDLELKTREEDGLPLFWVTKIGGPSHGFDYNGQCLLPLLANGRTKPILVEDPRWPHNASARAYLRVLKREDGAPVLYLEPLQRDFPHRTLFDKEDGVHWAALVAHAVAKAKAMGLELSLPTGAEPVYQALGIPGEVQSDRYVLEPSGGVFEASDTLTDKHDWVQTQREVTGALERFVVSPEGQP